MRCKYAAVLAPFFIISISDQPVYSEETYPGRASSQYFTLRDCCKIKGKTTYPLSANGPFIRLHRLVKTRSRHRVALHHDWEAKHPAMETHSEFRGGFLERREFHVLTNVGLVIYHALAIRLHLCWQRLNPSGRLLRWYQALDADTRGLWGTLQLLL
jgi:hypothetical protein